MAKTGKYKIAIAGAGSIASSNAKCFKALDDVEILAVAETNEERRNRFASEYNIENCVDDYEKLLDIEDIDAVVLCLPNFLHTPAAIKFMKAGKHVLTEKPMAIDGRSAEEMVKVQKETGRTLMVTMQAHYSSSIQLIKKQLKYKLGEIYYGKCCYMRRSGIPGWGSWFTRKEKSGGGPCADIGVHVLDQCLFLMDYPKPVSVTASTYSKFGPEGIGKGQWGFPEPDGYFNVEDLASAFIRFENGATVILEASWAMHWPDRRCVELLGTEGGLILDKEMKIFTSCGSTAVDLTLNTSDSDAPVIMARHFIDCCITGKKPDTSPQNGLLINKIFDAVYESSENNAKQVQITWKD